MGARYYHMYNECYDDGKCTLGPEWVLVITIDLL
jgi:hypothetical protein